MFEKYLRHIIAKNEKIPALEVLLQQLTTMAADELQMNEEQAQACHQLIDAAIQRDKVTHLYDGNFDALMVNAANLYSTGKDTESYILEGDFSNLFHCNKAIGKPLTNEIMAIIIDIYQQSFQEISPDLLYGSRSGGDEFRFIITGVSQAQLDQAIQTAQTKIETFVAELGLERLEHSKHPNNPGIGAEVAYQKLPVTFPSFELESALDNAISEKKRRSTERKIEKYGLVVEKPEDIASSAERLERIRSGIAKYHTPEKDHTDQKDFPFKDIKLEVQASNIFTKREEQIANMAIQLGMNVEQTRFFSYLLESIYDKKDEKTGLRCNRDFIDALNDFKDLCKDNSQTCYLVKMEAYNFSSLNELFSHFGNDLMFKQMTKIVQEQLPLDTVCFYRGGGIVAPILPGHKATEIDQALVSIIEAFHHTIGSKSIKEYCNENHIDYSVQALRKLNISERTKMSEIPSIRGLKPGSSFVVSKTDLTKCDHFAEALIILDQNNEQNKALGIAFRSNDKTITLQGEIVCQTQIAEDQQSTTMMFRKLGVDKLPSITQEKTEQTDNSNEIPRENTVSSEQSDDSTDHSKKL